MLSRCPHCDRPFVATGEEERTRCPHCGKETGETSEAAGPSHGGETRPAPSQTDAVVAEGGQPHQGDAGPGRRRNGVRPPPPRFDNGRPAWEQAERGLLARYFGTLADACLRPVAFFTHLSREGARGITWFGYVCVLLGTVGQALWGLVSYPFVKAMLERSAQSLTPEQVEAARAENSPFLDAMLDAMEGGQRLAEQLALVEAQLWVTLLLAPVTAFFTIHLLAGLVHFSVQTFRPPSEEPVPYEATYRFVVYAFAPMALGILPALGGIGSVYSLALLFIAIGRLHRVRVLGLVAGVLMPVLLLSWLWDQEALPRVAPPLAQALGIVEPVKAPPTEEATEETAADEAGEGDEGERASSYPPMPPADRDHSVEVFEAGSWLYTERSWDSSLGRLFIKQLAAKDASEGARLLVIEVTNQGERDIEHLFVEHELPEGARLAKGERVTQASVERAGGRLADDIAIDTDREPSRVTWRLRRLPAGGKAVLAMRTTGAEARPLLDTAPSVGRAVPEAATDTANDTDTGAGADAR